MLSSLDNLLLTWQAGKLWRHDSNQYNSFYGNAYTSSITVVFGNEAQLMKKTFEYISENSDNVWECGQIITQLKTNQVSPQTSNLVSSEFKFMEGQWNAAFKRDFNSNGGKISGDVLKGKYIIITLHTLGTESNNFIFLNDVAVGYIESPLNK